MAVAATLEQQRDFYKHLASAQKVGISIFQTGISEDAVQKKQ